VPLLSLQASASQVHHLGNSTRRESLIVCRVRFKTRVPLVALKGETMIHTLDVPKENWVNFTNILNRHALERPVRLEVVERELGDQELENSLPLRGLNFETKGSARGAFFITVGTDEGEITHRIDTPKRLYVGHNETDEMEFLAIDEEPNGTTFIYFEHLAALPEHVVGGTAESHPL